MVDIPWTTTQLQCFCISYFALYTLCIISCLGSTHITLFHFSGPKRVIGGGLFPVVKHCGTACAEISRTGWTPLCLISCLPLSLCVPCNLCRRSVVCTYRPQVFTVCDKSSGRLELILRPRSDSARQWPASGTCTDTWPRAAVARFSRRFYIPSGHTGKD